MITVWGFVARGTNLQHIPSALRHHICCLPLRKITSAMTKNNVIALFDVDGTLTVPRKVCLAADARICGIPRERLGAART